MKKLFFIVLMIMAALPAFARHVAGGELFYEYVSTNGSSNTYKITLRLFRDCQSNGPLLQNEQVTVGVYQGFSLYTSLSLPLQGSVNTIQLNTAALPCIIGAPTVCYEVAVYSATIDLPNNAVGYTLARYGCCRINNINNLNGNSSNIGSTYVTKIPGTNQLPTGHNSSPQFNVRDTALVCSNKNFSLDFGALDADNDTLTYSFCEAYNAPNGSNNQPPNSTLTLDPLPYSSPFFGGSPLGPNVIINPVTGIISGVAPAQGQYVVCVCITEWRNGKAISEHRKDFILKVQNCDIIDAQLPDKIINCKDFTVFFENQSASSAITSYTWTFGDGGTSNQATVTHTYSDTGKYKASLFVTGPNSCTGMDSTTVYIYPGFTPNFTFNGSCYQTPYQFADATTTAYGVVNSWSWDFGDVASTTDTSTKKNTAYLYPTAGNVNVQLIVTSSKGCVDTITKAIAIKDKPTLTLPFTDTLICSIDTLPLIAQGNGSFSWLPSYNIINANTANPLVYPKDTTTYTVTLNENGCTNTGTIKVNVLNFITVDAGRDSTICKTDAFNLHPTSHALQYVWRASTGEVVQAIKYPLVKPLANTMYYITANLGKCQDKDSVFIKPIPYPKANAGSDTEICFSDKIKLKGSIVGSSFVWSPLYNIQNANSLTPTVGPKITTNYILTSKDTLGCPKPSSDTVLITVIPQVKVFAGRDTSIVINQPLQLVAVSNFDNGTNFLWTPTIGLSNPNIANPIALLNASTDSIKYKVRATIPQGCYAEDDIVVKVFKTAPDIFVPTAFTPNGDFKNDIIKPIPVGIKRFEYFRLYNRWGQLIFETSEVGKGWDGSINSLPQQSGTYVFATQGIDYLDNIVFRKGTVVLIR
jgi:gliding motility-associated-like protein